MHQFRGFQFPPATFSLSFYLLVPFLLYLYVSIGSNIYYNKIFILTFCLLSPLLWSIILQNSFLLQMILLLFTASKNRQSYPHYCALILYVFVVCMCNTCCDVKQCNICLIVIECVGTVRCNAGGC